MSLKRSLLESAIKEKSLIGIRTESVAWGESVIGFVVELEESYFTLNEIDEYGYLIGLTQIAIEDVINIEIDDRYQRRLIYIYNNNLKFNRNERITIWKGGEELLPYIKTLIENKMVATFYLNEDDYVIGLALKYDKTYILIKNIGSEGDEDGTSYYPISKFIGLRYNSIEEQKIKLLYENRALFY